MKLCRYAACRTEEKQSEQINALYERARLTGEADPGVGAERKLAWAGVFIVPVSTVEQRQRICPAFVRSASERYMRICFATARATTRQRHHLAEAENRDVHCGSAWSARQGEHYSGELRWSYRRSEGTEVKGYDGRVILADWLQGWSAVAERR